MGPLIPVILAIAAYGCSTRYGVDENPILTDSGPGSEDAGMGPTPDAPSYSDTLQVELPNTDVITADLFSNDSGDVYGPDVVIGSDVAKDTLDIQPDVPVTPKFCEPKVSLPANCAITEVAGGGNVSCLIKSGKVYCAGKINSSVDPNTALFNSATFIEVPSLAGAKHIAVGGFHLCTIMPGNDVKCLGQNAWGQLGDGTTQDAKTAVVVGGLTNVAAISLGGFHSAGQDTSGKIFTWGFNISGQLGIASMPLTSSTPQAVSFQGNASVISVAAGAMHSVAVATDGTAYAWGNNALFPLGVGDATGKILTPTPLINSKLGLRIAAGDDFTLLLDQNCAVSSVGAGGLGQLGLGTTPNAPTLTPIPSLSGVAAVIVGGQHACAITQDGALFCWGENEFGDSIKTPTQVVGIQSVVQTSLGTSHAIALNTSCQVFVWGKNTVGQLGLGNTTDVPSPTLVTIN